MTATPVPTLAPSRPRRRRRRDPVAARVVRYWLIALALLVLFWMLVLPVVVVFVEAAGLPYAWKQVRAGTATWGDALAAGLREFWAQVDHPKTWSAVKLTFLTAAVAVPLNTVFGVAAAWCVTKYRFRGRTLLLTLIDLPFAISPVVAGLALILVFGQRAGIFGAFVNHEYELDLLVTTVTVSTKVVYAVPGIVLATVFITFPFVARELIPLMAAQGSDEETAARVLGATGWQTFRRVTLPNIKWGLLYGVVLCNARAMGEFGAVYVVSGLQADQMTLPLYVDSVYHANPTSSAPVFAVASILTVLAVVTLVLKVVAEWKYAAELKASERKE